MEKYFCRNRKRVQYKKNSNKLNSPHSLTIDYALDIILRILGSRMR